MPLCPKDVIEATFLQQYKQIIYDHKFHYIGFGLICIGIEFLGTCLDSAHDWDQQGFSQAHFEGIINELMPRYKPHSTLLYKQLRCGFAHGLLPGKEIELTHREESLKYESRHLKITWGALTLVIEDLYDDFQAACEAVMARKFPEDSKMNKPLLRVPGDPSGRAEYLASVPIAKTTAY